MSYRLGPCSVEGVASAIRSGDNDRIEQLGRMLASGSAAADPERTVVDVLAREPNRVGHVAVVAVGKSAAAIARGAARGLDVKRVGGVAVCDHVKELPDGNELIVTSHPTPDQLSVAAADIWLVCRRREKSPGPWKR